MDQTTTLADRRVIRVSGEDPRGFLQGLVTADTAALTPAMPAWSALLSPQGKALFDFILWAEGDALLIAGKGHETGQIVGDQVLPFSDHDAAMAALRTA